MLRIVLAAGLAGLLATAAIAQPDVPAASEPGGAMPSAPGSSSGVTTTTPTDPNADPDKVICRTVKPPTGTRVSSSRTRTKLCMTKREWDQQAVEAQEQLNQRNRGTCSGGNCAG